MNAHRSGMFGPSFRSGPTRYSGTTYVCAGCLVMVVHPGRRRGVLRVRSLRWRHHILFVLLQIERRDGLVIDRRLSHREELNPVRRVLVADEYCTEELIVPTKALQVCVLEPVEVFLDVEKLGGLVEELTCKFAALEVTLADPDVAVAELPVAID